MDTLGSFAALDLRDHPRTGGMGEGYEPIEFFDGGQNLLVGEQRQSGQRGHDRLDRGHADPGLLIGSVAVHGSSQTGSTDKSWVERFAESPVHNEIAGVHLDTLAARATR
ncbi:hypothetical protein [Enemella evansiae]|uniref:hypothetical protein n=1 Tax=Enemella evansiae TaxID=2016499 RepID=UPI001061E117